MMNWCSSLAHSLLVAATILIGKKMHTELTNEEDGPAEVTITYNFSKRSRRWSVTAIEPSSEFSERAKLLELVETEAKNPRVRRV